MIDVEIIGICASLLVFISFLFSEQKAIRIVNICGALLFVIYGILIGAFSVWFLNGGLIIVHIIHMVRLIRK